jgi:hypothetical protein
MSSDLLTEPAERIVISYSHQDRRLLDALVSLLKAAVSALKAVIFYDYQSLQYGQEWRPVIEQAIRDADQVLVFWCVHSAGSSEVEREYQYALNYEVRVVPVLLDDTPLCGSLAGIHGVDLRELATHEWAGPLRGHAQEPERVLSQAFAQTFQVSPERLEQALHAAAAEKAQRRLHGID